MATTLNDILNYIEARAETITDLVGRVKITYPGQPIPAFKDYGMRVYFGQDDWKEIQRNKIGPIVSEFYKVNVDLVFNRSLTPRDAFSDAKGLSYWEHAITALFMNKNNNRLFRDSYWEASLPMEINADSVIIRGILHVHLQNIYNS